MMSREIDEIRDMLEPIEDVPAMPEDTHARWVNAVHNTRQTAVKPSAPWKRGLAVAAAAVFLLGGTALTRDSLNKPAGNDTNTGMVMYSRSAVKSSADYGANNSVMLAAGAAYDSAAYQESAEAEEAVESRKLIRTIDMTIATRTYEASLAALTEACTAAGGWVESLSESSHDLRSAYLNLRVPAAALDDFLAGTDGWGRVTYRNENTRDVTESYQDTQARLATQQALMARLQSLVTEAADLSDVLALESQIADTQYEIDRLTSSLMKTDRQVDYATVTVSLQEEKPHADNPEQTLGQRLVSALASGWEFLVAWTGDTLVFLTAASPLIVLAGGVVVVWRIIRRKRKS